MWLRRRVTTEAFLALCAALLFLVPVAPARAAPAPISHYRYVAIAKTLKASLLLDSGDEAKWANTFRASCEQLNSSDPLLGAYRRVCLNWASGYESGLRYNGYCPYLQATTESPLKGISLVDKCQGRVSIQFASLQSQLIPASKTLNAALDRYVRTKACRKALYSTPALLNYYRDLAEADRLQGRGQIAGSSKETVAAANQLERIGNKYGSVIITNHQQLSEFRAGCR